MKIIVFLAAAGLLGGCGKAEVAKSDTPATVVAIERAPLVAGYEALRERFASDDLEGGKAAAAALSKVATAANEASVAASAEAIAKAADMAAARLAFGELSKAYLAVLAKKPELAQGLFAFRCPMAEGYQKWVQVDETLKNPYMGKKMLECGSKVDLTP